jgi:hypothetical protein
LEAIVRVAKDFAPHLSADALVDALDALAKPAAGQRLGFVLSVLRPKLVGPVAKWLRGRVTRREVLEPSDIAEGHAALYDAEWRIEHTERQVDLVKELA